MDITPVKEIIKEICQLYNIDSPTKTIDALTDEEIAEEIVRITKQINETKAMGIVFDIFKAYEIAARRDARKRGVILPQDHSQELLEIFDKIGNMVVGSMKKKIYKQ